MNAVSDSYEFATHTPELPADGAWPVTVTFSEPGDYVVRVLATDGGLTDHRDVKVTVR